MMILLLVLGLPDLFELLKILYVVSLIIKMKILLRINLKKEMIHYSLRILSWRIQNLIRMHFTLIFSKVKNSQCILFKSYKFSMYLVYFNFKLAFVNGMKFLIHQCYVLCYVSCTYSLH